MAKCVMLSIRPEWCKKIISGKKTVEVRKTKPKMETPFKVYIYCTQGYGKDTLNIPVSNQRLKDHYNATGSMQSLNCPIGNGKVIGEFVCDRITDTDIFLDNVTGWYVGCMYALEGSGLTELEVLSYCPKEGATVYGWHISDLVIYDEPKAISEFIGLRETKFGYAPVNMTRPPQSWCYVEEYK